MRRKLCFAACIIVAALVFPLLMTSCPTRPDGERGELILYRYPINELFNVGIRAFEAGRQNDAGWLEYDPATGLWDLSPHHNNWDSSGLDLSNYDNQFHGVRLFNIDRDLVLREWMDISQFDGFRFKYRTNMMNTELRVRDCMFWWGFSDEHIFQDWNWNSETNNVDTFRDPCPELGWREVVIPFHRLRRWGIPQNVTLPCNDVTRFNRMIFTGMRFDGRLPAHVTPGNTAAERNSQFWLEIVDFAFFRFP